MNNITIEKQLRRFIRHYSEICNLEDFFLLNRNKKYESLSIVWQVTFEYIKENEGALVTSFWTTKQRKNYKG